MRKKNLYRGSNFEEWLKDEGLYEEVHAAAVKRVLALQIAQQMTEQKLTKTALARRMKTSRPVVDRLLDPRNPSVTLSTLQKVARVLGKELKVEFV